MDWSALRFDWNRARAFLAVVEEGSLTAAARGLGVTQPTLGRQIAALEEELGVVLFERLGRGLTPTPSALALLEHVRQMGDAASALSVAATGQADALEGSVCITASEVWTAFILPPVVTALRAAHPGVTIELLASNAISDLRRREADIALRNAPPRDPDLIGRRLGFSEAQLYASDAYLEKVAPIETPEDFATCDFIGFQDNKDFLDGLIARGLPLTKHSFPVVSANHLVQWELVKAGAGVGVMVRQVGDRTPGVAPAAPWFEPFRFPVWLVAHRELRKSRRMRLVFDALAAADLGVVAGAAV